MRRPPTRVWAGTAVAVLVAVGAAVFVTGHHGSGSDPRTTARRIPARDGVELAAQVTTPRGAGRHPLLVMPASWGQGESEYAKVASDFADRGYVVVAYAQRGFGNSGGRVDFAGPTTQADASRVIDWSLAHTRADAAHVGMFGVSYGAGISLLAAAHDRRIRAVTALSTWTDLGASFDQDDTPSTAAVSTLVAAGKGRFAASVSGLVAASARSPSTVGAQARELSATRSPIGDVAALNRNRPAIMMANAYEDSIFPATQLVAFYRALTTPKRLQLAPGDHGGPELDALTGSTNETVDDARAWLDHYLRGRANSIVDERPIELRDVVTGHEHGYRTWPAATLRTPLDPPGPAVNVGSTAAATWSATIPAGADSGASSGVAQFLSASTYHPPTLQVGTISTRSAFTWNAGAVTAPVLVAGSPVVRLRVGTSAGSASIFAYLYDVSPDGTAALMSVQPHSVVAVAPGTTTQVTLSMPPTAWTVRSGHHLALVIDTVDARYRALAGAGSTVTVASSAGDPAAITLPISSDASASPPGPGQQDWMSVLTASGVTPG